MTDETAAKRVRDVVSEAEFVELVERCRAAATAQGGFFVFDEYAGFLGQRSLAGYMRRLALSVGMEELAARLDPDQFAASALEQRMMETAIVGRAMPEFGTSSSEVQGRE